jgi:DNA-binding transcriptional regulator GbsR (MarR family)
MQAEKQREEQASFADEVGLLYEDLGEPRSSGRVLGWLLVCEPDYQSTEDLATVLQISRGSISTTMRALTRDGLVERQTIRGDRRTYYRIRPGAWVRIFEDRLRINQRLCQLAERGLELLSGESAERRSRLQELHDLMMFYEREAPTLLERWHRERR